jgi:hypothetical protein
MQKTKMFIPQNISDLVDVLMWMILYAPKFTGSTAYSSFRNAGYQFRQLNEGLAFNRKNLGGDCYQMLAQMSDQMRALFEADPDDTTGDTAKGRRILQDMLEIVEQARRKD